MNILVTGANGQLGTAMRTIVASGFPTGDHYIFSDIVTGEDTVSLDITGREAVRLVCESEKVDVIVNCAGYTNVDGAESDQWMADQLNNAAVANLAAVAAERDAVLIHISTDYIFDGTSSIPIREDFPASPLGVYGATKLKGERAVAASGCRSIIIRTAWLYSGAGKNFFLTMRSLLSSRRSITVVADQIGTPTWAGDLASLIHRIITERQLGKTGTYNFSGEGVCSWYDFACAIKDACGLSGCEIVPCHSEEYPSKARRPSYSVLDKTLVKKTFGITIPHWHDSLMSCIRSVSP